MSKRYPGGVISKTAANTSLSGAGGLWSVTQAAQKTKIDEWPIGGVSNPIVNSLRFESAASSFLSRTPASAGNRRIFTWSGWVKRGSLGPGTIFNANPNSQFNGFGIQFNLETGNDLGVFNTNAGTNTVYAATLSLFRDPSAWYHIVVAIDTTQASSSNGIKVYVNGVQQSLNVIAYTQNADTNTNNTISHQIGRLTTASGGSGAHFDGYLSEVNFIDGSALTPSSFGQINPITGVWESIKYTGTYGTNGFYLPFRTPSNMGADESGRNNNWTLSGFNTSVANTTYDVVSDVPTQWTPRASTTDTGGIVRGNYATLNPLHYNELGNAITNGNLTGASITSVTSPFRRTYPSTIQVSSGKWYCELTVGSIGNGFELGIASAFGSNGVRSTFYSYNFYDQLYNVSGTTVSYGVRATNGQVIGMAVDLDAGTIEWFVNNSSQGQRTGIVSGNYFLYTDMGFNNPAQSGSINFGQRPFAYTPPSGFKTLCTTNLPEPTIGATVANAAGKYFNIVLYTGNGAASRPITGVGFKPDVVWTKRRSTSDNHHLFDSVRVVSSVPQRLFPNLTNVEDGNFGSLDSFDDDGFTVGSNVATNANGVTYVAWNWNAGGSTVTNTSGTISAQVRASQIARFSIVTYTGNGTSGATVGHGLGATPSMIIVQTRTGTNNRDKPVYHASLGNTRALVLNSTAAQDTWAGYWNNTSPNSTTFTLGNDQNTNTNGSTYVAYCFAAVPGYSAISSYTGNGSTDGPFVFTGFRPEFILVKRADTSGQNWRIQDAARDTFNTTQYALYPNTSGAEDSGFAIDFLSNGFKLRLTDNGSNASGSTYIYAAFAEHPFKNALAR